MKRKKRDILSNELKEKFYIQLYFNLNYDYDKAAIKRAYRDFNRTLWIKDGNKEKRDELREKAEDFLLKNLKELIIKNINSQEIFDIHHKELCINFTEHWKELTIGQSQKWINMTLKYWLLFGDTRIASIEKNAEFFHIPIDSYVLEGMFQDKYPKLAWSKITNYDDYFKYQIKHRESSPNTIPIIDEFSFFNEKDEVVNMNSKPIE